MYFFSVSAPLSKQCFVQVDTDTEMLTYIKDAYESWAATPGVADDMTKHIKTGMCHILNINNGNNNVLMVLMPAAWCCVFIFSIPM